METKLAATLKNYLIGRLAQATVLFFWVGGLLTPVVVLILAVTRCWLALSTVAAVLSLPFLVPRMFTRWPAFRAFIRRGTGAFKSCRIVFETPLDQLLSRPTMYIYSPHGVFAWGYVLHASMRDEFFGIKGIIAPSLYNAPLFRMFAGWTDCTTPAIKNLIEADMDRGVSFGVIPGAEEEAVSMRFDVDAACLSTRKGFVKLALRHGHRLVPVWTFGETRTYFQWQPAAELRRKAARRWGLPFILPWGGFFWLPRAVDLVTVYGNPIELPTIAEPTNADVDHWHSVYVENLRALYNRHKAIDGGEGHKNLIIR